jgi:isopenicillin N synthase-like dioxygenase
MGAAIPAIDVSWRGGPADRRACAAEIGWACREIGFFHIANHGGEAALRRQVFDRANRFFARSLAVKMRTALSADSGFMGYFPLEGETAGRGPKEGYDVSFGAANQWPEYLPELPGTLSEYYTVVADERGGLQVETEARDWIDVPPLRDAFVCDIGEMMALWTNSCSRATRHRVVRRHRAPAIPYPSSFIPIPTCRSSRCRPTGRQTVRRCPRRSPAASTCIGARAAPISHKRIVHGGGW